LNEKLMPEFRHLLHGSKEPYKKRIIMHQASGTELRRGAKDDKVRRLRLLAVGLSAALPMLASVPASAKATSEPKPPAAATPIEHCTDEVTSDSTEPGAVKCSAMFTKAIQYATDDPADNLLNDSKKSAETEQPAAADRIIAILYDLPYYDRSGGTYTIRRAAGCTHTTDDVDYQINLPERWWDRVSSFQVFEGCFAQFYSRLNYVPPATLYFDSRTTMPNTGHSFDNDARSLKLS
jgi:hypothetical protein